MATFSVNEMDVMLPLLRRGFARLGRPEVNVMSLAPDDIPSFVPLVVVRRTGGSSEAPRFWDQPWLAIQCWDAPTDTADARRNAHDLADQVRRIIWEAWETQTTTPAGWIANVRESSAPEEINDPDLPLFSRYQATYELRIRKNPYAA